MTISHKSCLVFTMRSGSISNRFEALSGSQVEFNGIYISQKTHNLSEGVPEKVNTNTKRCSGTLTNHWQVTHLCDWRLSWSVSHRESLNICLSVFYALDVSEQWIIRLLQTSIYGAVWRPKLQLLNNQQLLQYILVAGGFILFHKTVQQNCCTD